MFVVFGLCWSVRAQFYAVTDLGTFGGDNAQAYGVNNHEQVVGTAQTGTGQYHAFLFDGGRMADLGTMGGRNSWAHGVNDNGWAVGASGMLMTNVHAFLCTNALMNPEMMDLGTLGGSNSVAWMIDMHGDVVGWAMMPNGNQHAFFMTNSMPGDMMDLGTVGGTNSEAYCINSNRMVVGGTMLSNGATEPFMSTNGLLGSSSMMTMGMGSIGAVGGQSWSVNDMGETAGQAMMLGGNSHAFVSGARRGMMGQTVVDLGTLGGTNSIAYGLNNAGTAVGMAQTASGMPHAFMVTNALGGMGGMIQMIDLNNLISTDTGWELMVARGINTAGQIVGWGMHNRHTNAFLLTPVSAPIMMTRAPTTQVVGSGAVVVLLMQMNADEPLTYQWLHDEVPIPGATNATYRIPCMNMANAGRYTVTARNAVGMVASSSAALSMFGVAIMNGSPHLTIAAPSGSHFNIDYSDTLGSSANWQTMTNLTTVASISQMKDVAAQGMRSRFFRAVMLP